MENTVNIQKNKNKKLKKHKNEKMKTTKNGLNQIFRKVNFLK